MELPIEMKTLLNLRTDKVIVVGPNVVCTIKDKGPRGLGPLETRGPMGPRAS